jgi:hypothetical protein
MIFIYFYYIFYVYAELPINSRVPSGILKNDKLYGFAPAEFRDSIPKMVIYTLKDGPVSEIQKTELNITYAPSGYMPQLLNLNGNLENGVSNEVWMIESYLSSIVGANKFNNSKWMAQFVDDKQLNFGSGFIKLPNFTYFPKGGYSQNYVNINNNPALYIIGGFTISKEINSRVLTSCVFKYDFISKSWSDLSDGSKSILPPIAVHRAVQVNNALYIFNGVVANTSDTNYPQTSAKILTNKINTINMTYKLDLLTGKWTRISIKTNLDPTIYDEGNMFGASYDHYNGNIVSYGSIFSNDPGTDGPRFGTLDLSSYEWHWNQIKTESGLDNTLGINFHQTLVLKDQLILYLGNIEILYFAYLLTKHIGYSNQKNNYGPYVINLKDSTLKSNLNYSENNDTPDGFPVYIKVIIGLGAALGFILLITLIILYVRYRKRKTGARNNKQEIKALWAVPENQNQKYISEGGIVNVNQTNSNQSDDIFTLEINDNDSEIRKSFMSDELNGLTLARQELQLINISKSSTKSST